MRLRPRSPLYPTRRLAAAIAILSPVWLLSGWQAGLLIAVAVSAMLVLAVAIDAALTPSLRHVRVERQMPRTAGIGDRTEGSYLVTLDWPRALKATIHDAMPAGLGREAGPATHIEMIPGSGVSAPITFTPSQRGRHSIGPVVLRVEGPLGLVRRTLRYAPDDNITITPSLAGVRRYRLLALQHRLRDAGVRIIRRRGQGTNFANLRDYAVGDDPRHIDWKASARRNRFITREFTIEQGQTIMIAVDAGRMMTQLSGRLPRFEHALSSALVLTDVAVHSRDQVGLIVFDDEVRAFVPPSRGKAALENIRGALITARATMVEPDYAMAFRTLETRHRKRSLIVLFTDVIDARSSQAILAHTARSALRHLPLVVALRNDQLAEGAMPRAGGPETSTELFATAAAEELVSAREGALLRMRRTGVSVLDVSPRLMTAAVINRYLELKARSSL